MRNWIWIPVLVLGLGLVGCSDDDTSPTDPGGTPEYPAAITPDQAMANFEQAWQEMDIEEYTKLLHPEFRFFYDARLVVGLKDELPPWTREIELSVVGNAFLGQPLADGKASALSPPILGISFGDFVALDEEWESQDAVPGMEGTFRRRFLIRAAITYQDAEEPVEVAGEQWFYVEPLISSEETLWQIKVWADQADADKAGTDSESWSELKLDWGDDLLPEAVTLSQPADEDVTSSSVLLNWSESADPEFSHYRIVKHVAGGLGSLVTEITDAATLNYRVEGLAHQTQYSFRVDVVDSEGWIGKGNTITVTTDEISLFQPATTPDLAMQNFEVAWENLNFVEYSNLLASEFQFYFDPADNLEEFTGGPSWQLQDELASTQAMFSNQSGVDPVTQEVVPPILSIEFLNFIPMDENWQFFPDVPDQGIYRNTFRQRYQVSMRVTYQGEELTTLVTGVQYFYLTPVEVDGQLLYSIKVWEDRGDEGGNKGMAPRTSWGSMKAVWN